jgi:hypothetical protein
MKRCRLATLARRIARSAFVVAAVALGVACVSAGSASAAARAGSACRVPRLKGFTLMLARSRAARAGCRLHVRGIGLEHAGARTVARQSPGARARSASVTVWLSPVTVTNSDGPQAAQVAPIAVPPQSSPEPPPLPVATPSCALEGGPASGSRTPDPEVEGPFGNPHVTPGASEFVSGFYMEGGPAVPTGCEWTAPTPSAGTVEVTNASGELVATQTSEYRHLVEIPLPPGSYTITSTFVSATICEGPGSEHCVHPIETYPVTIQAGYTLREDFIIQIP